jgi:LmbE family N-acetylglucosaminyl deacetylase
MMAADYMRAAEALPLVGVAGMMSYGKALILAPHPDDEALGCGGLIAALAGLGMPPHVAFMSDGAGSHPRSRRYPRATLRALRQKEAREAVAILGAGEPSFLDWPDGAVPAEGPGFEEAVQRIAALAEGHDTLVATSGLDPHIDHIATCAIARAVARRRGMRLLLYPIWSWRYLHPEMMPIEPREAPGAPSGVRLDISRQLDRKRRAVMAHRSQTTRLIDDDPDGFMLTEGMLSILIRPFEVFLEDAP